MVATAEHDIVINGIRVEHAYEFIDKADWGPGEWQTERFDKVQWTDEATGLPCLALRHPRNGHWCGYVGVPEGHPVFGLNYDEADRLGPTHQEEDSDYSWRGFSVHGGLTFSNTCSEEEDAEEQGICHIPQPGQPDRVWWLGFDACHAGDGMPGYQSALTLLLPRFAPSLFPAERGDVYRTLPYIQGECAHLAQQLADVTTAEDAPRA